MLPSCWKVEQLCLRVPKGKVTGDAVHANLMSAFPFQLAQLLQPLLALLCITKREPIAWNGGTLHELSKGKGPLMDCPSYRSIL
eukprot:4224472-Alexandrium_andersonii.AAC.1